MIQHIGSADPNAPAFSDSWVDLVLEPFYWLGRKLADVFGIVWKEARAVALLGLAFFLAVLILIRAV